MKELYAEYIGKPGVYLGLLDIALLAFHSKSDVAILYYGSENQNPRRLVDLLSAFLEQSDCDNVDLASVFPMPDSALHGDRWYMIACRADWRHATQVNECNHWVPAFHKDDMNEAKWNLHKATLEAQLAAEIERTAKELAKLAQSSEQLEEDEGVAESLSAQWVSLEQKQAFLNAMHSRDLSPDFVPADGNCGIWSFLALNAREPGTTLSKSEMKEVRKESWHPFCREGWDSDCPFLSLSTNWAPMITIDYH